MDTVMPRVGCRVPVTAIPEVPAPVDTRVELGGFRCSFILLGRRVLCTFHGTLLYFCTLV